MKVALAAIVLVMIAGCGPKASDPAKPAAAEPAAVTKLKIEDKKVGTGPAAKLGDTVTVLYEGRLGNGTVFDATSRRDNEPFPVVLGRNQVMQGWEQGLVGVKKGGVRKLSIPSELAYGEKGSLPDIPPNTDIFFDITVQDIQPAGSQDEVALEEVKVGSGRAVTTGDTVTLKYAWIDKKGKQIGTNVTTVKLGNPKLLPAVNDGVLGMKKGGQRELTIPAKFGVGARGMRYGLPMSESVRFRVELVAVK